MGLDNLLQVAQVLCLGWSSSNTSAISEREVLTLEPRKDLSLLRTRHPEGKGSRTSLVHSPAGAQRPVWALLGSSQFCSESSGLHLALTPYFIISTPPSPAGAFLPGTAALLIVSWECLMPSQLHTPATFRVSCSALRLPAPGLALPNLCDPAQGPSLNPPWLSRQSGAFSLLGQESG